MLLLRRNHGSQRAKTPLKLSLFPDGSGDPVVVLRDDEGNWFTLAPESMEEMRALLSAVHVAHHNMEK